MIHKIILLVFFSFATINMFGQISGNSLLGIYAGTYYHKDLNGIVSITADTVKVTSVDTTACTVYANFGYFYFGGGQTHMYTSYTYCFANPGNFQTLFKSNDSLRIIYDNVPTPPTMALQTMRFLGKKVPGIITNVQKQTGDLNTYQIFPNPADHEINISGLPNSEDAVVKIFNTEGKIIYENKYSNLSALAINTANYANGLYYVQILTSKNILTQKIVLIKNP